MKEQSVLTLVYYFKMSRDFWKNSSQTVIISDIYNDTIKIIMLFVIQFIGIILGIFLLYGLYRFRKIKRLLIIKKRYPNIIYIEGIMALYLVLIQYTLMYFAQTQFSFIPIDFNIRIHTLLCVIFTIFQQGIHWCEASRLWLMYFQLNYINSVDNSYWENEINSNRTKYNFYLNNKVSVCIYSGDYMTLN